MTGKVRKTAREFVLSEKRSASPSSQCALLVSVGATEAVCFSFRDAIFLSHLYSLTRLQVLSHYFIVCSLACCCFFERIKMYILVNIINILESSSVCFLKFSDGGTFSANGRRFSIYCDSREHKQLSLCIASVVNDKAKR